MNLFISCAIGLEPLLAEEVEALVENSLVKPTRAGVFVEANLEQAYRVALWSRVASRVLIPIFESEATVDDLYKRTTEQDWSQYLYPGAAIAIDFSGKNKHIRHTRFGALKIKDGIADWHTERDLDAPMMQKDGPDIRLSARINKGKVSVALDFSGEAMHRRGYRERQGVAPLRENLAAGILYRAKWPTLAKEGLDLCDPMCGSGTLVIEAAMMATDCAPGLRRKFWGFDYWPGHDDALWKKLLTEAEQRFKQGKKDCASRFYGSDSNAYMVRVSRDNASRAALHELMDFKTNDATTVKAPSEKKGLLISNPPYGERLGEEAQVALLYEKLGENFISEFNGWNAAVLAANSEFGRRLGMHSHKQYQIDNGSLSCMLLLLDIQNENVIHKKKTVEPSEGSRMVANRIKKNMARLNSWLSQKDIQAFRVYDADIPEYSAAIDIYQTLEGRQAVVQEYAPPKEVEASKAKHRLNEIVTAVGTYFSLGEEFIYIKSRERQRGDNQYERLEAGSDQSDSVSLVIEDTARLEVNLEDYLDTGLFLDHRPMRRQIRKLAAGKSFLNLFCYTSVATVQAALGGAKRSLSVDMSNTYLDWSERNFRMNNMDLSKHRLLREDCLKFLHLQSLAADEKFDLIFLDPPSFSNSKRMEGVLDIQRDHAKMISQATRLLEKDGILLFSTNLRKFKMDVEALSNFDLEDITDSSFDPDFQRNQRIHQCWKIQVRDQTEYF